MTGVPVISLVVAAAENGIIGRDGELPWRLREDLRRFKAVTLGKPVVMGRKTHESIGRPLPGRRNIVVTRQPDYVADGCDVVSSVSAALAAAEGVPEVMVIGGAEIYRQFLPQADRIYLTRVLADVNGDTRFPELAAGDWREAEREIVAADASNEFDAMFVTLERIRR